MKFHGNYTNNSQYRVLHLVFLMNPQKIASVMIIKLINLSETKHRFRVFVRIRSNVSINSKQVLYAEKIPGKFTGTRANFPSFAREISYSQLVPRDTVSTYYRALGIRICR